MMEKVKRGEINLICVKDFSLFSRDYIETGNYLECTFPFMDVRFISINDGYDSDDYKGTTGGLEVVMRSIIYAAYSKDLSVKTTSAKIQMMKQGKYVGGYAPYGYVLHPTIRNKLAVDPEAAYAFSVIPSILLSPFALLLAPTFRAASIFLIVYGSFWSTLFATITGIMTIDKRYLDNASTLELKGFKKLFRVILPAASPSILAGFVNSLRSTFVMLVYAEMYGAQYGMGFFVKRYSEFGIYENVWAGFIFMVVILVIVMQLFEKLKKRLLKWTIG